MQPVYVPLEEQLRAMKTLVVLLMTSAGLNRVEFPTSQFYDIPDDTTITTWNDLARGCVVVEVNG